MALDLLLNLLSSLPSVVSNMKGQSTPYIQQQEALAGKLGGVGDAMMDPNNPAYQALYKQSKDQQNASLAQTIAEAQGQNRMATRTGRTPLFSPERGGETQFRALMQQQQGVGQQAATAARSTLQQAGNDYASGLNAYNTLTPIGAKNRYQTDVQPFQDISSIIKGISGSQAAPQTTASNPITWNTPRMPQEDWNTGKKYVPGGFF